MHLWLLRHAKSSWDDPTLTDELRPLSPRGRRAAKTMRRHLDRAKVRPDLVVCSTAVRTRQTLDRVLPALGGPEVEIDAVMYTFDGSVLAERVRRVPADIGSLMLIGHNPAIQELAERVAGAGERLDDLRAKYPTGALAGIEFAFDDWSALGREHGRLTSFVTPRELG